MDSNKNFNDDEEHTQTPCCSSSLNAINPCQQKFEEGEIHKKLLLEIEKSIYDRIIYSTTFKHLYFELGEILVNKSLKIFLAMKQTLKAQIENNAEFNDRERFYKVLENTCNDIRNLYDVLLATSKKAYETFNCLKEKLLFKMDVVETNDIPNQNCLGFKYKTLINDRLYASKAFLMIYYNLMDVCSKIYLCYLCMKQILKAQLDNNGVLNFEKLQKAYETILKDYDFIFLALSKIRVLAYDNFSTRKDQFDGSELAIIEMKYKDRHYFYLDNEYLPIFKKFNSAIEKDFEKLSKQLSLASGKFITPQIAQFENQCFRLKINAEKNVKPLKNGDKFEQIPESSNVEVTQQTTQHKYNLIIEIHQDERCKDIFDAYNQGILGKDINLLAQFLSTVIGKPVPRVIAWHQNQKFIATKKPTIEKADDYIPSLKPKIEVNGYTSHSVNINNTLTNKGIILHMQPDCAETVEHMRDTLKKYDEYSKVRADKTKKVQKHFLRSMINFEKVLSYKKQIQNFFKSKPSTSTSLKSKFGMRKAKTIPNAEITIIFDFYGDMLQVTLDPSLTICEIKSQLEKAWYFDKIIFNGKQLDDHKTLLDYKIKDHCTLHCVHSIQGGGCLKEACKSDDLQNEINPIEAVDNRKTKADEEIPMEIDEKIPAESLLGTQVNTQVSEATSIVSGASDLISSGVFENIDDPTAKLKYPENSPNFNDAKEEDINVVMANNESLQLIAASIEDITSTSLSFAELNDVKNDEYINDHVLTVQLYREVILENENKVLMVLPVFWQNPYGFKNWDAEKLDVPDRLPTYPVKSSTFQDAIILINIGNKHWSFAIMNMETKTCTHYCSVRWKLSDHHETHVKRICKMLSGVEMNIDTAPINSYYRQKDGVNCGPLCVILPKRILNNEKLDFDISVINRWRQMVYDYNIGFLQLPITQQQPTQNMEPPSKKPKIIEHLEIYQNDSVENISNDLQVSKKSPLKNFLDDNPFSQLTYHPNTEPFPATEFANMDDPDLRRGLSRESLNKIINGGYIGDTTIVKEVYRTIIRGYENERILVSPCNWISNHPFDNWSANIKDKFRLQTYPEYSSTFKFAVIPIHFGIHWTFAILDKERKRFTYFDTFKNRPPADILFKLKRICFLLCGEMNCKIIYPPIDSFYHQTDIVDCGALCCILIHRYFTGQNMNFIRDVVFAWRHERYYYYHPITPLDDKPTTPTPTQDAIKIIEKDKGKDVICGPNILPISEPDKIKVIEPNAKKLKPDFTIIVTAPDENETQKENILIESYDDFIKRRKIKKCAASKKKYETWKKGFQNPENKQSIIGTFEVDQTISDTDSIIEPIPKINKLLTFQEFCLKYHYTQNTLQSSRNKYNVYKKKFYEENPSKEIPSDDKIFDEKLNYSDDDWKSKESTDSDTSMQSDSIPKRRGRPPKKQVKNRYTSKASVSIKQNKDNLKIVISDGLTESQKLMPPPQLGKIYEKATKPRRSERIAAQLPKVTPITERCHHEGKIHKEGCAAKSVNHEVHYHDVGDFNIACPHCKAWLNEFEARTPSRANKCCANGKVDLSEDHDILQNQIPKLLQELTNPDHPNYQHFQKNSRVYNNYTSFGSMTADKVPPPPTRGPPVVVMNGLIEYRASGLLPPDGKKERNAQLFTLDLEEALKIRGEDAKESGLKEEILKMLHRMLGEHNDLAKFYKDGSERLAKSIEECQKQNKEQPQFRMVIVDAREEKDFKARNPDIHVHSGEKPRNEMVGLIWCNDTGDNSEPPPVHGVWLYGSKGETHLIPYYSPNIDPLCYALLFPRGTQIYHSGMLLKTKMNEAKKKTYNDLMYEDILLSQDDVDNHMNQSDDEGDSDEEEHRNSEENNKLLDGGKAENEKSKDKDENVPSADNKKCPRTFVSRKQAYRYHLYPRSENGFKSEPHWLYSKGTVSDEWIIGAATRADRHTLDMMKKKIEESNTRSTTSDEMRAFLQKKIDNELGPNKKLGKVFTMPLNFKGSRKYMQRAYTNIMTIIDKKGLPDWFITFTGNPNWPEITRNKSDPKEMSRYDLKCRVFLAKAQEFLDDLFKRHVMGKVKGYHVVMEFQKRGMPHMHIILIMKDKVTQADVDNYVSARIPDLPNPKDTSLEAEQQRRYYSLVDKHMVHYCGQNSGCQINGECTKNYPKQFSSATILHTHKPADYQRLPPKSDKADKPAIIVSDKNVPDIATVEQKITDSLDKDMILDGEDEFQEPSYVDEIRKDFDLISFIDYKRLPPPPVGVEINETNDHLFGNVLEKKLGKAMVKLTDCNIVPHNRYFLLKFDCHINVECTVGQTGSPKYTCKYLTKGGDYIFAKIHKVIGKDENGVEIIDYNESEEHICARIMTAPEAYMRLHDTWIIKQSDIVDDLPIHLKGQEYVVFEEGEEEKAGYRTPITRLTAFFNLCQEDPEACNYTYPEITKKYWFCKPEKRWKLRVNAPPDDYITFIHHVSPRNSELYALRLLLLTVKGPKSYEDLKTVKNEENQTTKVHETFLSAAQSLGLWHSDQMHEDSIDAAFNALRGDKQKRHYFAMVLAFNQVGTPENFLEKFLDRMFPAPRYTDPKLTKAKRRMDALNYLEYIFQKLGTSCKILGFNVDKDFEDKFDGNLAAKDFEIPDELPDLPGTGRKMTLQEYADSERSKLNEGQSNAFDEVLDAIKKKNGGFYFLEGQGGAGKTHLYNSLITYCLANGINVQAAASTGIAATLLKNGMTAHAAFFIPLNLTPETNSNIERQSKKGVYLEKLDLIIIDEVSMLNKNCMWFINRLLQDLRKNKELFGNTVVLIGGDWKQLTPVVPKGTEADIIQASIKSWEEFKFARQLNLTQNMRVNPDEVEFVEELKNIGNGVKSLFLPGTNSIAVDAANIVKDEPELINFCLEPEWLKKPLENAENLCGSAILCPRNDVVQRMNDDILARMTGEERIFKAIDRIQDSCIEKNPLERNDAEYSIEKMASIESATLPPHQIKLKKGAIVMLLRNLSIFDGLCNGTRMQIIDMKDEYLECRILTGPRAKSKENVLIPKILMEYGRNPGEGEIKFTRYQFPVKLAFAMTINKAQGQTLNRVGLYFRQGECFSHGQLYTAMSRVRTKDSIRILTVAPNRNTTRNIVWPKLLDDPQQNQPVVQPIIKH